MGEGRELQNLKDDFEARIWHNEFILSTIGVAAKLVTSSTDWKETTGKWWIPGYEDQACRGVLSFVPDQGAHLSIVDSEIFPAQAPGAGLHGQYPVINGFTADGRWVTLLDCFDFDGKWRSSGWDEKTIFSNIILDGCHLTKKDD